MSGASLTRNIGHAFGENRLTLVAVAILLLLLLCAAFGSLLAPYDPLMTDGTAKLMPPNAVHLFGTDALGRDIFSRVIVAARLDLGMAISAVLLSFVVGLALGAISGYFGGWADRVIGRVMDTIMAFPLFVLAMGIVAALGNSVLNIIIATMIINLPFYCRFARGGFLQHRCRKEVYARHYLLGRRGLPCPGGWLARVVPLPLRVRIPPPPDAPRETTTA